MPKRESPTQVHAFELWYSLGKDFRKTHETLRLNTPPVNVSRNTVYTWAKLYDWDGRAKERDMAVAKKRTEDSINAQVDFMKRKGNYGKLLQRRALEFLNRVQMDSQGNPRRDAKGNPIPIDHVTNAATAAQLLLQGVQLEQASLGLPEWITEAMTVDDETLRRVYETALAELASSANYDGGSGDSNKTFPAVVVESVQQDDKGSK